MACPLVLAPGERPNHDAIAKTNRAVPHPVQRVTSVGTCISGHLLPVSGRVWVVPECKGRIARLSSRPGATYPSKVVFT